MTLGMTAARIGAGLLLGTLALAFSFAAKDLSHFSLVVWCMAVPVAGAIAATNASIQGKHFKWWRSCHDGGILRYICINALTGAVTVAMSAYPGMLLGILGF